MEQGKNKNGVIISLVILVIILAVLCVLFATGTISFNNKNNNDLINDNNIIDNQSENSNTEDSLQSTNNVHNFENNDSSKWMNYIINQNITGITIERHVYTGVGDSYDKVFKNITIEQLKSIFEKFKNYKMNKLYYIAVGYPVGDILTITYNINNIEYELQISKGEIWFAEEIKDTNLIASLDNSIYSSINENIKNEGNNFHYNYRLESFTNSVYDDFFK